MTLHCFTLCSLWCLCYFEWYIASHLVPSGPPRNIRVERISTTAVKVTWEDPAPEHINAVGGITGYEVVIGSKKCRKTEKSIETTNLKAVFDGLKPGTMYCVRLFPLNSIGAAPDDIVRDSAVTVEFPHVLRKLATVLHHHNVLYILHVYTGNTASQLHQSLLVRQCHQHMLLLLGRRWNPRMARTL